MAEGDSVKTASVEIEANIVVNEESLTDLKAKLANATQVDATPRTEVRGKRGTNQTDVQATVKAKLDERKLENDIQSVLDGGFRLSIDKASIRAQVEEALSQAFTIRVNAEVTGGQQQAAVGAQPAPGIVHAAPVGRGAPPDDVKQALKQPLKDAIDVLYRNINEAFAAAGKGRFGSQSIDPGNQAEKAIELIGQFGGSFEDMLRETKRPGKASTYTGSLSPKELGAALGIDPKHPALQSVQANALGLTTRNSEGETSTRGINVALTRLAKWAATTPISVQPAAASTPTAAPADAADREANRKLIDAQEKAVVEARKGVLEERQRALTTRPIDTGSFASGPRLVGPRTASADPEADTRARRELGLDRGNVRRLRGLGSEISFGGKSVRLEDYLRAAEAGQFEGVFEQFGKGGESKGITGLASTNPTGDDAPDPAAIEEELTRLKGRKPGVKFGIAGQEGRFARVHPSEALIRKVISDLGISEDAASSDAVRASLQGEMERIRQATQKGSSPARGTSGATKRGQGAAGIVSVGSMKPDPEFDPFAQTRRLTSREIALRNLESQKNVAEGVGFTSRERDLRAAQSPESQGLIGKLGLQSMGLEGGADTIRSALMQRYLGNQSRVGNEEFEGGAGRANPIRDANGNIIGWGAGEATVGRGSNNGKQTLRRAAFGPTGRARRDPGEDEDAGIYGELVSQIPGDTPRETKKTLSKAIYDILSATLEDDTFKRDAAEQAIAAKEGATTRPVGRTREIGSAIATDDGIERISFRHPISGEGGYIGIPPGIKGATAAAIELNRRRKSGEAEMPDPNLPRNKGEFPYFDPDTAQASMEETESVVANVMEERRQAMLTRQKTLGRGKYQTGDETTALAREAGVPMEPEVKPLPFAGFSAKYGPNAESAGAPAGAGGGFGSITGTIPVRVMNWPSGWGGGGGGRPPRGRTAEGGDMQPEDDGTSGGGKASKRIRYVGRERVVASTGKQKFIEDQEKMYSGLFDQQDREAAAREKQRTRAVKGYNKALQPPVGRDERSDMYASMFDKIEREDQKSQRRIAKQAGLTSGQYASPAALRRTIGLPSQEERSTADFNLLDQADKRRSELAATARRAERGIPKRGFTASVTDIFANLGGFLDDQVAAVTRYQREGQQLSSLLEKQAKSGLEVRDRTVVAREASTLEAGAQAHVDYLKQIGASKEEIQGATAALGHFKSLTKAAAGSVKQGEEALVSYTASVENQAKIVAKTEKALPGAGGKALAFGVGFGAAAGAVAVGQLVSQVTQVLIEGMQEAVGPIAERLTGFGATTGRVQGELATGLRGANDDRTAVLAQTATTARLSTAQLDLIRQPLDERAQTVEGTQSLAQQRDLSNAGRNIRLGETGGFDRALFRSTGGLFDFHGQGPLSDISVGGQASTAETLAGSIRDLTTPQALDRLNETNPTIGDNLGIGDNFQTRQANDQNLRTKLLDENNIQLKSLNDNLKGSKFSLTQGGASKGDLDAQAELFAKAGAQSLGEALKDAGIIVQGIDKNANPTQQAGEFLKTFNQGPQLDVQQLLDLNARQRSAQLQGRRNQLDFDVSQIPLQRAQQQATQPLGRADAGIKFSKNDSPEQVKRLNTDLEATQTHYDNINTEIDLGIQKSKEFVASAQGIRPQDAAAYGTAIDKVRSISLDISKIQIGDETKQAAFQAKQFDYQIYLAKRNLQDAKGLVSGVGNNLGAVERQMFDLQRQSQALSLGQNQRQINFQVAAAGFQAPGLTSEERQARIEDAKLQASYAQKQLDIQKKLYGLSGKQFDIGAARQVEDLSKQISLLTEGRSIALDVQVDQKKIKGLEADLAGAQAEASTYYNAALGFTSDVMAQETALVAATGEALTTVANQVIAAFSKTISGITTQLNRLSDTRVNPATGQTYVGDPQQDYNGNAGGFLGTVSGTTSLGNLGVAGESAGEAVAIVKNPQQLMTPLGGGAGETTININVTGNKFTSEDDESRIMGKIVRAVEEAQARKGALIGLRPFGG